MDLGLEPCTLPYLPTPGSTGVESTWPGAGADARAGIAVQGGTSLLRWLSPKVRARQSQSVCPTSLESELGRTGQVWLLHSTTGDPEARRGSIRDRGMEGEESALRGRQILTHTSIHPSIHPLTPHILVARLQRGRHSVFAE